MSTKRTAPSSMPSGKPQAATKEQPEQAEQPRKSRKPRRTPEEQIAELEAKLAATRARAAAKNDPMLRTLNRALGSVTKALAVASEQDEEETMEMLLSIETTLNAAIQERTAS